MSANGVAPEAEDFLKRQVVYTEELNKRIEYEIIQHFLGTFTGSFLEASTIEGQEFASTNTQAFLVVGLIELSNVRHLSGSKGS